jgi:uncharacterized protein with FMN-binding domain
MKKFLLSIGLVAIFGFYVLVQKFQTSSTAALGSGDITQTQTTPTPLASASPIPTAAGASPTPTPTSQTTTTPTPTKAPTPTPTPAGKFKNGNYTGSVADAFYGNVQVKAIVSGGRLTNIQILQEPNDRGTSREIAAQAFPQLISEAISSQSSSVDIVSGATQDSEAFRQSLSAALNQAI